MQHQAHIWNNTETQVGKFQGTLLAKKLQIRYEKNGDFMRSGTKSLPQGVALSTHLFSKGKQKSSLDLSFWSFLLQRALSSCFFKFPSPPDLFSSLWSSLCSSVLLIGGYCDVVSLSLLVLLKSLNQRGRVQSKWSHPHMCVTGCHYPAACSLIFGCSFGIYMDFRFTPCERTLMYVKVWSACTTNPPWLPWLKSS